MTNIKAAFILLLFLFSCNLYSSTLSESSVSDLISSVQESVQEKNIAQLVSFFTEDAKITIEMPRNMGGTITLSKTQYKDMLKQGWAMPGKYTYEVQNITITISPDSKTAVVTDVTIETIEVGGQVIRSTSQETLNIVVEKGRPMIKRLYGKVQL